MIRLYFLSTDIIIPTRRLPHFSPENQTFPALCFWTCKCQMLKSIFHPWWLLFFHGPGLEVREKWVFWRGKSTDCPFKTLGPWIHSVNQHCPIHYHGGFASSWICCCSAMRWMLGVVAYEEHKMPGSFATIQITRELRITGMILKLGLWCPLNLNWNHGALLVPLVLTRNLQKIESCQSFCIFCLGFALRSVLNFNECRTDQLPEVCHKRLHYGSITPSWHFYGWGLR